jgi:hypothetical protein
MCFAPSNVTGLSKYNWDGDVIIQQPIVPSGRKVVGVRSRSSYDIDVREFLTSTHNAVMHRVLHCDIPCYMLQEKGNLGRFQARTRGSFDYRAAVITNFVADTIAYSAGKIRDPWQFPDETLALKAGDCEDRAFLIASLLLASGVSSFNVRVAFGQMVVGSKAHDHMWVVYKNERGYWTLIEPLRLGKALAEEHLPRVRKLGQSPPPVEYVPRFLFNDCHLWAVKGTAEQADLDLFLSREWARLDPKFAGGVHLSIIEEAIGGIAGVPSWVLKELKRNFSRLFLFGPVVDSIDLNIFDYNPLDHFDNGYIEESWGQVSQNLASFSQDSRANLQAFARAAHAIADFYAHSSYVHFANLVSPASPSGHAEIGDLPGIAGLETVPSYEPPSTFDLTDPKFSVNESLWTQGKEAAAQRWIGQLISGRYAQPNDTQSGLINHVLEGLSDIPQGLKDAPGFADRGSLPHHNEIAVDDVKPGDQHCLYGDGKGETDRMSYANQLRWRRNTAILHVRKAFRDNFTPSGDGGTEHGNG